MVHGYRRWLLLAGLSLTIPSLPVHAQPGGQFGTATGSHADLPKEGAARDSEALAKQFRDRLVKARAQQLAREILKDPAKVGQLAQEILKDPAKIEALKKNGPLVQDLSKLDLNDPKWRELAERLVPKQKDSATPFLEPKTLEGIQKLFRSKTKTEATPSESGAQPRVRPTAPESLPSFAPNITPESLRSLLRLRFPETAPTDPDTQAKRAQFAREMMRLMNRLEDAAPFLRNSPTMREVIREMDRYRGSAEKNWFDMSAMGNKLGERLPGLREYLDLDRLMGTGNWSLASGLPSLPRWDWSWGGGPFWGGSSGWGAPGLPRAELPGGGGWRLFWWLAVLLAAGFAVWRVLPRFREDLGASADGWKLGPWPVKPAAVRTREELVRAFEHLALRSLGWKAQNWHHHHIAAELGDHVAGDTAKRRRAAAELAEVYERARYAPGAEPLSDSLLAAARRDLCFLAGVSAA